MAKRIRDKRTEDRKIIPDPEDVAAVAASPGTEDEKYRLAQAHKLIRLYEQGLLPVEQMRALRTGSNKGIARTPAGTLHLAQ